MNRPSFHSILGLALIFSLVGFLPAPSWAGCKNTGGGGSAFSYGSEVTGKAVTICLNTSAVVPARTSTISMAVPRSVARAVPKAVTKSVPKLAAKPVIKVLRPLTLADIRALMRAADAPAPKKIVVAKPKPALKPKIVIKTLASVVSVLSTTAAGNSSANGAAYFSPDESAAAVSPSNNLSAGQLATFFSDPKVHYRLGSILGRSAEVRFTPVQTSWAFGDGTGAQGVQSSHSFTSGNFDVEVTITYSVSYRFSGQPEWVGDPGLIEMPATVLVLVSDGGNQAPIPPEPQARIPYLVSANCLANFSAVGC